MNADLLISYVTPHQILARRNEYDHSINQLTLLFKKNVDPNTRAFNSFITGVKELSIKALEKMGYTINKIRIAEAFLVQEHIIRNHGFYQDWQIPRFLDFLKPPQSANCERLCKELSNVQATISWLERTILLPEGRRRWAQEVQKNLQTMQPGISMWINTNAAGHGMMMHITKTEDSFELRYSNTGFGLHITDFHRRKRDKNGKTVYQTVALIKDINEKLLIEGDFFYKFASALYAEKIGDMNSVIGLMYQTMRELGVPIAMGTETEDERRYWSRSQYGTSCSTGCIWAMVKVVLSHCELHQLKTEMRIKVLLSLYTDITEGNDESSACKIMALDLIQKLKGVHKKQGTASPEVFDAIEKELLNDLKMISPEAEILNASKITISTIVTQSDQASEYSLQPLKATYLKLEKKECILAVEFEPIQDKGIYTLIQDPQDSDQWIGKTVFDSLYLLYFYIAQGDQIKSSIYLLQAMNRISELEDSLNLPDPSTVLINKAHLTASLLSSLAQQLKSNDNTRSGIAKRAVLAQLAESINSHMKIKTCLIKDTQLLCKEDYMTMHVDFYLPEDHMYVEAYRILSKLK
jgi:hypothetical protein